MMEPVETLHLMVFRGIIEDPGLNRLGIPQGPAGDSAGLVGGSGYRVCISCL